MKVVINGCFGGFGLSDKAMAKYNELAGTNHTGSSYYNIERNDPFLVQVVEELGDEASDFYAELRVVDVPDEAKWYIHDYDGLESVYEQHRIWN